jgi:hypothetical protein
VIIIFVGVSGREELRTAADRVFTARNSIDQSYVTGSQWPRQIGRCFLNRRCRVKLYNFGRAEATLSLLMPISVTPNFLVMVSIAHRINAAYDL